MAYEHSGAQAVYAPNSFGRGYSDFEGVVAEGWEADGEMVRQAYQLHAQDDDWTQAGSLIREVFDNDARDRFVETVAGALADVRDDVLERAFIYWKNVDDETGKRIEEKVHSSVAVSSDTAADVVIAEEGTSPSATV
jgi:catalase